MTRNDTYVVIALGNTASINFWPYSRKQKPKQFLDFFGIGKSLLQTTYEQSKGICPEENIYITVSKDHAHWVAEQLPHVSAHQILHEPVRRNSAPCIAYACYKIKQRDPNAVIVVTPTDHIILGEVAFVRDIRKAVEVASADRDKLLVVGIKPHKPEVNYRYIQYRYDSGGVVKKVKTFTEKPQSDLAQLFLDSGDFIWNTDIYVWHVEAILAAYRKYLPDVAEIFEEGAGYYYAEEENAFIQRAYSHCKCVSISHGILEKSNNVHTLIGNFDWAGVNCWNSLYELKPKDPHNNAVEADAFLYESKDCYVKGPKNKLIVIHNLEGYLVTDTDDVLLICPRNMEEKLKDFTSDAKSKKGDRFV